MGDQNKFIERQIILLHCMKRNQVRYHAVNLDQNINIENLGIGSGRSQSQFTEKSNRENYK